MNHVQENKHFNWMKYRIFYFAISAVFILIGIISVVKWQFLLGIDFAGGTNIEYSFENTPDTTLLYSKLSEKKIELVSATPSSKKNVLDLKFGSINQTEKETILSVLKDVGGISSTLLSFEQVGPSLSAELLKKTLYAVLLSALVILGWIAYQFRSFKFGISATVATLHDALIVLGLFSLFGHFFHAEIDYLFVTALLTILSFSVHDTIVVYDRIREIRRKHGGSVKDVANRALSETMRRSFFNSFTIIIMLIALAVLGGETIRWFAIALAIGTISGTYSSPFIAVPVLVTWEVIERKLKSNVKHNS